MTRKAAVRHADKWYSLYIRKITQMEYGKCPFCGKPIEHCFHWFSRVAYSLRWDVRNGIGSCAGCNIKMEYQPYEFYQWLTKKTSQEFVDTLNREWHKIAKFTTAEIKEIGDKYKRMYEELAG